MAQPTELPSSPAARAFFAALDGAQETSSSDGRQRLPSSSSSNNKRCSSSIQKRIATLGWRNRYSQDDHYPIQIGSSTSFKVIQVQRGEVEGTYGTGATVWPASVVLIKYLERHAATLLHEKRVVDLGAGTGATSIAAALLGASHCVCTDGEAAVVQLAQVNIRNAARELNENNGTHTDCSTLESVIRIRNCLVSAEKYWWGTGSIAAMGDTQCDVVLVSDCVLPKLYPIAPLVDALDQLLVSPRALAILSYEHRYFAEYDPRDKFRELCHAKGLIVLVIPMDEQDPVYSVDDIEIWHVRREP
jgi:predicted nicotinamide N-methyase